MALTPEAKVKQKCKDIFKKHGVWHFSPSMNGMGRAGIPDLICCVNGLFLAVECKAGKGKTTALQDRELAAIQTAEGVALVVNEDNLDELEQIIEGLLLDE
jgi:Holliday junction resolvase